jgi:hypothetical protein
MMFRMRFKQLGGHIHVRVFESSNGVTWAKNGELVFDEQSWPAWRSKMDSLRITVLPEEEPTT